MLLEGIITFPTGGHGNFDFLATQAVERLRQIDPRIRFVLGAAYPAALRSQRRKEGAFDNAFVPDTLAKAPAKAALVCRNRWMAQLACHCFRLPHHWRRLYRRILCQKKGCCHKVPVLSGIFCQIMLPC